jgi:predicted Rossmann fold nucleotide-binding protein DprA/Smf involved in DNA uptake
MPSDFLREKLTEIEARIGELSERIDELETLLQERDALTRARDALAGELAAIEPSAPARRPNEPVAGDPPPQPAPAGAPRARRRRSAALAPEAERVAEDVLAVLADAPGLTVDELAARTSKAPAALHRLLLVLVDRGRVVRDDGHFSAA